jgi:hypothetical protein
MYYRKAHRRPRALSGVSTSFGLAIPRRTLGPLGSLGAADDPGQNTLSDPTLPYTQWEADVINQLRAGVLTLQHAELQKWLQIAATLLIPVSAAIWKTIFKKGAAASDSSVT